MIRSGGFFNIPILFVIIFSMFVLAGCTQSATSIKYDSPAPPEKNCTLYIARTLIMKKFDAQNVEWDAGLTDSWIMVQIPEGSHTFGFNYVSNATGGNFPSYSASGLSVIYDRFVAGRVYLLAEAIHPAGMKSSYLQIGIKDVTDEPDWGTFTFSKAFNQEDGFEWLPIIK